MNKELFVLGSGPSILNLTDAEIDYINAADIVIGMNKFFAYWELSKIRPKQVFFLDRHGPSIQVLQEIFDKVANENNAPSPDFILNQKMKVGMFRSRNLLYHAFKWLPKNKYLSLPYYHIIPSLSIDYVEVYNSLVGGDWATKKGERLYHYRSSLTSVLNYLGVNHPGQSIKLIGVDLNRPDYFFEQQIKAKNQDDWTTAQTRSKKRHFTVQNYRGGSMLDVLPFMVEELKKTGNDLYCCNAQSLLVKEQLVDYLPIIL